MINVVRILFNVNLLMTKTYIKDMEKAGVDMFHV